MPMYQPFSSGSTVQGGRVVSVSRKNAGPSPGQKAQEQALAMGWGGGGSAQNWLRQQAKQQTRQRKALEAGFADPEQFKLAQKISKLQSKLQKGKGNKQKIQQKLKQLGPKPLSIEEQQLQDEQEARQSAEERYKDILNRFAGTKEQVLGSFGAALGEADTFGQTARQAVQEATARQRAQAEQDLVSRGLANTTVQQSVQRGITADAMRARTGIEEDVARQRSGLLTQRAETEQQLGRLGIDTALSRRDEQPDSATYLNLLRALNRQVSA